MIFDRSFVTVRNVVVSNNHYRLRAAELNSLNSDKLPGHFLNGLGTMLGVYGT